MSNATTQNTETRRGVTVIDRGSRQTRNGVAWAAEVHVLGKRLRVENDGNGGSDHWTRLDGERMHEGLTEPLAELARLARSEPALAEHAELLEYLSAYEAAGFFVASALDGALHVMSA